MNLSEISTADLVRELSKRDGVEVVVAEPYELYTITVGNQRVEGAGPAIILQILD